MVWVRIIIPFLSKFPFFFVHPQYHILCLNHATEPVSTSDSLLAPVRHSSGFCVVKGKEEPSAVAVVAEFTVEVAAADVTQSLGFKI